MTVNVYQGDCIDIVPKLNKQYDFIFCDPPFNIGQKYIDYHDDVAAVDYIAFVRRFIFECCRATKFDGVMCLHGPDDLIELYLGESRSQNMPRVAWLNWHYRFGQNSRANWVDSRAHCLIFANPGYTWNPESVLVESDRASKYNDVRIQDTENGGERLPFTIWGLPSDGPYWGRVQGNNGERSPDGQPNQLPEKYLERLILAYTNEGDSILDPFGGTGQLPL